MSEFERELREIRATRESEVVEQRRKEEQKATERRLEHQRLIESRQKAKYELFEREALPRSPMVERLLGAVANATWGSSNYVFTFEEIPSHGYLGQNDSSENDLALWRVGRTKRVVWKRNKNLFGLEKGAPQLIESWISDFVPLDQGLSHEFFEVKLRKNESGGLYFAVPDGAGVSSLGVPNPPTIKGITKGTGKNELRDLLKEEFIRGCHSDFYKEPSWPERGG